MSFIGDIVDSITGKSAADAAQNATNAQIQAGQDAIAEQRRASEQGLGFLQPFSELGQRAINESSFLANPQAQFDFLQNNPLFQLSLDNANQATNASAAARGRLSAGDTLQQLSNNVLLTSQPLIDRQRQDVNNLLNLGAGIATTQANTALGTGSNVSDLLTGIGNVQGSGIIAGQNARQGGLLGQLGGLVGGSLLNSLGGKLTSFLDS